MRRSAQFSVIGSFGGAAGPGAAIVARWPATVVSVPRIQPLRPSRHMNDATSPVLPEREYNRTEERFGFRGVRHGRAAHVVRGRLTRVMVPLEDA